MSRKRLMLLGIALAAMLLAGNDSNVHAKAQAAQRSPGGPGGGRAEPDVAFIVPNDIGDKGPNDSASQGSQLRGANPAPPQAIDPQSDLSVRQRLQILREAGFSGAMIRLFRAMFIAG